MAPQRLAIDAAAMAASCLAALIRDRREEAAQDASGGRKSD